MFSWWDRARLTLLRHLLGRHCMHYSECVADLPGTAATLLPRVTVLDLPVRTTREAGVLAVEWERMIATLDDA